MGKVSKIGILHRRLRSLKQQRLKKWMRPPYRCPMCFHKTLFVEQKKSTLLVKLYCTVCKLGELMPNHISFSKVDYYNFLCDYWLQLNPAYDELFKERIPPPKFKYKKYQLTEKQLKYLKEHTSYGEIVIVSP